MKTDNGVCRLIVERNIYPATRWHWAVEMPDGCQYAVSWGDFESLHECMDDAGKEGLNTLEDAERAWACSHLGYALKTGMMRVENGRKGTEADDLTDETDEELGKREIGCLTAFACVALIILSLLAWGIWNACGRWPALCETVPMAGAALMLVGIFETGRAWRGKKHDGDAAGHR